MGFHEDAGDADRHRRPCQHGYELALTARRGALPARQLHRVGGIEDHRASRLAHDRQTAHVGDQIVIAEGSTPLAHHDAVAVEPGVDCGLAGLVGDIFHVVRRQKLPLLDIGRLAAGGHRTNEIGLTA